MNADASTLPWQVLLVDDEPAVHEVTRLVLREFITRLVAICAIGPG